MCPEVDNEFEGGKGKFYRGILDGFQTSDDEDWEYIQNLSQLYTVAVLKDGMDCHIPTSESYEGMPEEVRDEFEAFWSSVIKLGLSKLQKVDIKGVDFSGKSLGENYREICEKYGLPIIEGKITKNDFYRSRKEFIRAWKEYGLL